MTLDPILNAPLIVQLHLAAVVPTLILGPVALYRKRRDRVHRVTGYLWVLSLLALAWIGFAIPSAEMAVVGPFGPIHLLSAFATWGVIEGVIHARAGRVKEHRAAMRSVYFGTVVIAGLFTLLPGRTLNRTFFPDDPGTGAVLVVTGLIVLLARWALRRSAIRKRSA